MGLAREWDRDKILARDRGRRAGKRERSHEPEEEEEETRRPASTKSLEELFNKTRATPAVYWKPLSSVSTVASGCGSCRIGYCSSNRIWDLDTDLPQSPLFHTCEREIFAIENCANLRACTSVSFLDYLLR